MSRFRAFAAATAVAVGLVLASALPASAHDSLIGSDPAESAVLDTAPTTVTLTYSADLLTLGSVVEIVDGAQKNWAVEGEPTVDADVVTVDVQPDMPAGAYEVRWRVVSSDGHPISGVIPFTVAGSPAVDPTPSDEPTAVQTSEAVPSASAAVVPAPSDAPEASTGETGDSTALNITLIAVGVVIVAGIVVFLVVRSRRSGTAAQRGDER